MKKLLLLILTTLIGFTTATAQSLGVNTTMPAASAALDVTSTTQGMLVPRMTTAQRDLIATPATGLLVYQTDGTAGFYFYNGTAWTSLSGGGGSALPAQAGNGGKLLSTNGTTASWVPGGGLYDANNNKLGVILGVTPAYVTISTSTGHIVNVLWTPGANGANFSVSGIGSVVWSGVCTGTPYANSGTQTSSTKRYAKFLYYSISANQLYELGSPDANGMSTSTLVASYYTENTNTGVCSGTQGTNSYLFPTVAVTPAQVGLPTTITYPLSIK